MGNIRKTDVQTNFTAACFGTLKNRISYDLPFKLKESVIYKPMTIKTKNEEYIFDFAGRDKGKAVFVKIFHDENITFSMPKQG